MSVLSRVMLMVRQPRASAEFFNLIGVRSLHVSEELAQLQAGSVRIDLVQAQTEAVLSTGYSPVLSFQLQPDELATCVPQLIMKGAHLDGAIQHRLHETVACLRTADGHMIALIEPLSGSGQA
jgi:catechol-2,3-dioxygenase